MPTINVPDYSPFEGIADGVKQGLLNFQNQQNIKHHNQMEGLMSGIQMDGMGRPVGLMPWKQQQMQTQSSLQQQQLQNEQTQGILGKSQLSTYQRENDPNNDLGMAGAFAKQGVNIPSGLSYKESKDVGEGQVIAKLRAQLAAQNKNLIGPKDWAKMGDDLDPTKNRQGTYGDANKLLNSTERLDKIFQQFPDGNIPGPQMAELANATAALYGGGSAQSQHQIDSIIPHSLVGDVRGIESYFANMPIGKDQQKFVSLMKDTSDREKQYAQDIMHKNAGAKLGKYEGEYNQDPNHFARLAKDRGINPDEIDSYGHFIPGKTGLMNPGQPQAQAKTISQDQVNAYAKQHGLNPDQAAQIFKGRGYAIQ